MWLRQELVLEKRKPAWKQELSGMSDLWGRWGHEARSTSWSPVVESGEMEILESSGSQ